MAVYLIEAPSGTRLVEAKTKSSAINHVMQTEVTAQTLNTSQLVEQIKAGMTIETIGETEKDERQIDVEDHIEEQVEQEEAA